MSAPLCDKYDSRNLRNRIESLTEGCFLLSAVPRLFQYINSSGVDGPCRGRRERAGSSHSYELMLRKRADVSMTTCEGAASCCYIITVPSSPFFHDFNQSPILSFLLLVIKFLKLTFQWEGCFSHQ